MRYFYDTEFIEDGSTIELVSIGIVGEDGSEYYAVSTEANHQLANRWVRDNVLSKLPNPSSKVWKSRQTIREEVLAFLTRNDDRPQLWAWVGAYDHVVLAQLWGDMRSMPRQLPHFTHELRQYWEMAGKPSLPEVPEGSHDALVDARHNLKKFQACMQALPLNERSSAIG